MQNINEVFKSLNFEKIMGRYTISLQQKKRNKFVKTSRYLLVFQKFYQKLF